MSRFRLDRFLTLGFSIILIGAVSAGIANAHDCSNEQSLKSPSSNEATLLSFQNRSAERRRIYWIDENGERKFYGTVEPGNRYEQPTFAGHAWLVTDDAEKCLYTFLASARPETVVLGEAAATSVPPPAQPVIAQAPAAEPQPVASEPVPQISPIEQFQLNGLYRLLTQLDGTKALYSQSTGTLVTIAVQPDWENAQWSFEAVPGTPFVRIKNDLKGTYLADSDGKPRAIAAAPETYATHWTVEPIDGTPYVQFRNRETDRFLLAVGGTTALVDDLNQDLENNSHWRLVPVTAGVAAPPPPSRPLYDVALTNCRAVGGIWTGSSCRRPVYMTEPLVCPRGFVWADDIGECLWDGGRCPPWQLGPGGFCGRNMACHGGFVAPGSRGYPACYCPPGAVAWGNYPNLSCVPSVARVVSLLVPAIVGGVAVGIIAGGHGRPPIGKFFGNGKFGKGQIGNNTPIGITVPVKLTGGGTGTPIGGGGTTNPTGGGRIGKAVSSTIDPITGIQTNTTVDPTGKTTTQQFCAAGFTGTPPNCAKTGTAGGGTTTNPTGGGQTGTAMSSTVDPKTGIQTNTTVDPKTGKTTTQQVCAAGYSGTPPNCAKTGTAGGSTTTNPTGGGQTGTAMSSTVDPKTGIQTNTTVDPKTGKTTTQQVCAAGYTGTPPNCVKTATTTNPNPTSGGGATVVTCTGGTVVKGACECSTNTTITGSGNTFQCEAKATKVIRQQNDPTTAPTNKSGKAACRPNEHTAGCDCEAPMIIERHHCVAPSNQNPTTGGGTMTTNPTSGGGTTTPTKKTCPLNHTLVNDVCDEVKQPPTNTGGGSKNNNTGNNTNSGGNTNKGNNSGGSTTTTKGNNNNTNTGNNNNGGNNNGGNNGVRQQQGSGQTCPPPRHVVGPRGRCI